MKMQPIAEMWDSFSREVLTGAYKPVERNNLRLAFFAGALALNGILYEILGSKAGQWSPEQLVQLKAIDAEMRAFIASARAAAIEKRIATERGDLNVGPDESICPSCEQGTHDDDVYMEAGFACSCPCHEKKQ